MQLQKGRTWYQSKGYKTDNENFNFFIKILRNLDIDDVTTNINKIVNSKLLVELWNDSVKHFKEENKENENILSNFVKYIWDKNCDIYVKLYPLLAQFLPEIPDMGHLTKTLTSDINYLYSL